MSWAQLSLYIQSRNTSDQSQDDTGRAGMEAGQLHDEEGRCDAQSMRLNSSLFHWTHIIYFQPQRFLRSSIDLPVILICRPNVAAQKLIHGAGEFGWNEALRSGMIPTSARQQT